MNNRFQKIALISAMLSSFAIPAHAGYLEDVAAGNTTTSAASAPEAAKPTAPSLLKCAKNYGRVFLEEEQLVAYSASYNFARIGFAAEYVTPILQRHAVAQSACFMEVTNAPALANYTLKSEVMESSTEVPVAKKSGVDPIGFLLGRKSYAPPPTPVLSSVKVVVTVVNKTTGEVIASVTGVGKSSDVATGDALLVNAPSSISDSGETSPSLKVLAAGFADAFNKLVPHMDKQNVAVAHPVTQTK